MALVSIQRSPSTSSSPPSSEYGSSNYSLEEEFYINRSLSEYYFAVKGFAVLLPKNECQQVRRKKSAVPPTDIQSHLQIILNVLRPGDVLQMAVRLESFHMGRIRYLVVVGTTGKQDTDESSLIGVDFTDITPTVGLVLPVFADTKIDLDGDGGFNVSSASRNNIFKPISVQAMWSALQTLHKESGKARDNHYYQGSLNHDWVGFYDKNISSDQSCINEWNAMDNLESRRPPSPDSLTNKEETKLLIRNKLKEIMMSVNIDDVTSKYIRQRLEEELSMDLFKFKSFIDKEMLTIVGQMDSATEIFPHVYLGSEWNASNLEELKKNKVGFILNVTKEIDNFYPGMFDYLNIRVYDNEKTELLRHWDDTYKYISHVREKESKVLVHCKMGISRSASVVIAYAMKAFNMSLEKATDIVKKKRSCIKPNQAFLSQLKIYQGILDASRQRHNALFRSKSETNLKSCSQTNLQQRSLHNPSINENSSVENKAISDELTIPEYKPKVDSEETILKLNVPPSSAPRPKSWSPDEQLSHLISPRHCGETGLGEIQKCQSFNDQIWQAHVTLKEHNGRIHNNEELLEAVNPFYIQSPGHQVDNLQLSSSVKERITEFESVQTTSGSLNALNTSKSSLKTRSPDAEIASSMYISGVELSTSTTDDIDVFMNSIHSTPTDIPEENIYFSPLESFQPQIQQQQIDTLNPVSIKSTSPCSVLNSVSIKSTSPCSVSVPNESITWPTGIVKKQLEDFEGLVKGQECLPLKSPTKSKENENNLFRQTSSHSLSAIEESLVHIPSKDLWKVEKKPEDLKFSSDHHKETEIPSRNNSWGSFDSAVVLRERETPSRQSSWGSCDTRLSSCSIISRNSSFGAFDAKVNKENTAIHSSVYDKEMEYSPATLRKNLNNDNKPSTPILEHNIPARDLHLVKTNKFYGPTPFRIANKDHETMCTRSHTSPNNVSEYLMCRSTSTPLNNILKNTIIKVDSPYSSLERSQSSTSMSQQKKIHPITRSASEKRPKKITPVNSINVKKMMSSLENSWNVCVRERPYSKSSMVRCHSLERVDRHIRNASDKRLSASPCLQSIDRSDSQSFLDQLVVETEAQVNELEEIKVKNLVDLFEEGKKPLLDISPSGENTFPRRKNPRPRSDIILDLPPVPQRKSSLDLNFKSISGSPSCPNRTCSTQVRRRKQQGKTHPLSKLTPRENLL